MDHSPACPPDAPATPATATPPSAGRERPCALLAVVMERVLQPNRWEDVAFRVLDVIPDEGAYGDTPRKMFDDGRHSRWLYPGMRIELFPDECKGYFLNLTSGKPAWFVMWRPDEADPLMARPQVVSVSYIECDRWMAAEERVDSLPLPDPLCEWLRLFTNEHFRPDGPRRQRAQSFLSPQERDRRARGEST
ncbi:MAG: DUF3305 domain-containing protein [Rubrivivax sp.]|jgi:hypothetical protein|nr:DUF3305 domain-containing protein [Rubrivivax sp.]